MIDAYCHHHGSRVLLTVRHLLGVDELEGTRRVRLRCWCGAEVTSTLARPRVAR